MKKKKKQLKPQKKQPKKSAGNVLRENTKKSKSPDVISDSAQCVEKEGKQSIHRKTKKPKKLPNMDSWVIVKLRRASLMWPGRTKALQAARVERGLYKCAMCEGHFKKGEYHLDHIDSVVPLDGKIMRPPDYKRIDWNIYIDRLFVAPEKYQVLCVTCHASKTAVENNYRQLNKKSKE